MEENSLKDTIGIKYIAHYRSDFKNSLFLGPEKQEREPQGKDNKLIFPGANSIVLNNLSGNYENERVQSFFHTLPGSRGINCIAQSPNKKFFAWSEETQKLPVIVLVDLTTGKRKMFATETKNRRYIALAFNGTEGSDPRVLVALTNGPEYSIVQWNFEKNKFVCNVIDKLDKPESNKLEKDNGAAGEKYTELFFFKEEDFIVLIGRGTIKTFKLVNDKVQLKDSPFARKEINEKDYNFISHCLLKDGLLIGTDNGEIFYFTINCEFKLILQSSPGEGFAIETMLFLPASKSFLVGSSEGQLFLYEKGDIKSMYVRSDRHLSLKDYKGRITSLLATPKEDEIFIGLQPGIILKASMEKTDHLHYDHALQSFHTDAITGMDVCLRKPLVATCSHDKTVRVWNHAERNNLQICKDFEEKALSLAFHPSGLHLAVSFPDKIKLINIIDSDLVPYKELSQKNCYEVKFSNGGHLFAVVNSLMVQIYNFYTCEQPPNYQFKALGGRFQCVVWEEDDLGIFLGTSDGTVLYNKLEDPTVRLTVLSVPGFSVRSIFSVFSSKDEKQGTVNERVVYAAGTFGANFEPQSRCIYEIKITPKSDKDKERSEPTKDESRYVISAPHKIFTSCNISRIGMLNSKKIFFYCADDKGAPGCIRYCRYPLTGVKEIAEIQSHVGTIGKFSVCYDDNEIFTAGEDGSFIIYDVKDKDCKMKTEILDPAEEFLFSKKKLLEKKLELENLRSKNARVKEERQEAATKSKMENSKQIADWDQRIKERADSERRRMDQQMDQIVRIQQQQQRRLAALELEHKNKRESVERDYAEKILLEQTRKAQLAKTKELQARTFNEIIQLNKQKHHEEVQRRTSELKEQLKRQTAGKELLEMKLSQLKSRNDQEQLGAEAAAERDIKQKKEQHEENIKKLQQEYSSAESQKLSKRNDHDFEQRKLLEQKQHLKKSLQQIEKINQTHEQLLQEKQSHAKEIEERQKTIKDKGTRIQELKKKTQELEKFKFVLDYKIKELKREIGPREEEIAKMKEQISNMNAEITHFKRMNANMTLIVKDLVSKKKGMENELEQQNRVEMSNQSYIKSFETEVSEMYQNTIGVYSLVIQDFKRLKAKMLDIFRKYVQDDDDKKKKIDTIDQQKEYIKERAHLESTVKGLKDKFKNSMKLHEADHKRIMGQNEDLISEINDLKREKKNMLDEVKKREQQKKVVQNLELQKIDLAKESEQLNARLKSLKVEYEQLLKHNKNREQGARRSEEQQREEEAI